MNFLWTYSFEWFRVFKTNWILYKKQSPFKGSDRELRGQIIKLLTDKNIIELKDLLLLSDRSEEKVEKIVNKMVKEQIIICDGSKITFTD